ncbi:MAG: NAD(P)/FAD-dependent oxidoreductase [Acidimicrobiales bacterium]
MTSPRVAILGAGAAGLCVAIKLIEAGVDDVTILEKSDGVGGTWRANTYPGAACDVPSHLYSFSFAPKRDWTRKFAEQPEILRYFEDVCDRYDLRRRIRFHTEVTSARFDDEAGTWTLESVTTDDGERGPVASETFDVVVSGLGQLNRPYVPDIAGLDGFDGPVFHSAAWDHDVDLTGKRVAVVGNGASALQFIPHVARVAEHVTIFQRSANWILPKPDRAFSERERWVFRHVPGAERLFRWRVYWRLEMNFLLMRRSSRLGRLATKAIAKQLRKMVSDRLPEAALVPDYPLGCKRILISNDYYQTLLRPDVDVELSHIARVEPDAVVTEDGVRHEVDAILLGTGFRSTEFLAPMVVHGRGGVDLNDRWAGGATAHLGVAVSGFPNFFMLYGPNTNLGHNSIIFMIEAQSRYIAKVVKELATDRLAWVDVRSDVMDRYNTELQREADGTVWVADCDNWYKNDQGVVTNNWPAFTVSYWNRMRHYRPYEFVRHARTAPVGADA